MTEYQKNPAYKNVNSSSMFYVEAPKLVKVSPLDSPPLSLPPKNPGYKNVNSSSMKYVEPYKQTSETGKVSNKEPTPGYAYNNYCSIY